MNSRLSFVLFAVLLPMLYVLMCVAVTVFVFRIMVAAESMDGKMETFEIECVCSEPRISCER